MVWNIFSIDWWLEIIYDQLTFIFFRGVGIPPARFECLGQCHQRLGGNCEWEKDLCSLSQLQAHTRSAGILGWKLSVHYVGDALPSSIKLWGDDVHFAICQPGQGHQSFSHKESWLVVSRGFKYFQPTFFEVFSRGMDTMAMQWVI